MELRDVKMTEVENPPSKLRRSVASARALEAADNTPDDLDMTAFVERLESDVADLDQAEAIGTIRYKRQRKARLIKRIRRKHGFKILTVTLLIIFFVLLANS